MTSLWVPLDANAWGLVAHVAYTHHVLNHLALFPLLPLPFLGVMQRYPQWVMAGACLPDLAVVSKHMSHSHGWGIAQQLIQAEDELTVALGIGYNIHLLADVVAHQHFVPSFEAKWQSDSLLTHAKAEWAMDAHIARQHLQSAHIARLYTQPSHIAHDYAQQAQPVHNKASTMPLPMPAQLLRTHPARIAHALANPLAVAPKVIETAVKHLAIADHALRFSRIPSMLYARYRSKDNEFVTKLDYYQSQVHLTLLDLPQVLAGRFPTMHAEHIHLSLAQLTAWRQKCLQDARLRPTRAIGLFEHYQHQWQNRPDC